MATVLHQHQRRFHFLIFCFIFAMLPLAAQERQKLTLETMTDPSLFQAFSVPTTWWLSDNSVAIYDTRKPMGERTLERLDPTTGKRTTMYDHQKASESFKALFPDGDAPPLPPIPSGMTSDGKFGYHLIGGDVFVVEIARAVVHRATNTKEAEKSVNLSPDGSKVAFVRENDLYVYDLTSKTESRLTADGSETILNGTLSWVYWEEIFGRQDIGYWWSPDSRAIAFLRTDESSVSMQHYVDISPWTPTVTKQRYPKVGETNPSVRVGIAEVGSSSTVWVGIEPTAYEYIIRVDWLPGSKRMCVRTLNRLQTELDFYFVDRATGAAKFILKDSNEGWINMSDDLHFLNDGKHFIISSERDGYAHLYRYTMDGKLVNQITKGPWTLSSSGTVFWVRKAIAGIDEKNGWIYFTALEKSSVEKHFYRINIDGRGMQRLTKEDGTHIVSMSPNSRYYLARYSNITTPPSLSLFEANGKRKQVLAESTLGGLKNYDAQFPELLQIPARDGFMLPASITKPKVMDTNRKYPVIVHVYGGPSAPTVANAFSSGMIWENVLLSEGYITLKVDNRAATAISKTLENLLLMRSPGEIELNDLVDAVRWLKQQPFVDPDRFGVWGWSGGGTNTMLAMTRSQEFKAGIAGAGVTDFRFYDTKWAEAMMRTEKENLEGYEKYSLLPSAKDLHGKLMLIHGTHDDNVHIQNTWRFIEELIKAGKLYELAVYPMRGHGVGDPAGRRHLNKTMLDFWKRNL
jgi:dipeptidyl-peptidase-4